MRTPNQAIDFRDVVDTRLRNPCATLEQIGEKYHVTKERIRQILKKAGVPTKAIVERQEIHCLNCGQITSNRKFCSRECCHEHAWIQIACEVCGKLRFYSISNVRWKQQRGKQQHFFCSYTCLGKRLGKNFGFGVFPKHRNTSDNAHNGKLGRFRGWLRSIIGR